MMHQFYIPFRLSGLNEYTLKCRSNRFAGAACKSKNEKYCIQSIHEQIPDLHITAPVKLHFTWHEKTKRRDLDNVAFAKKFIQDSLVQTGVLNGDNHRYVKGFTDDFVYDGRDGVEVVIEEL